MTTLQPHSERAQRHAEAVQKDAAAMLAEPGDMTVRQAFVRRVFNLDWLAAAIVTLKGGAPPGAPERLTPEQAWQDLAEKDDRTSPAEYPEMVLISFTELSSLMYGSELTRAEAHLVAERRRHVLEEGWTADHDDEHPAGELAKAGAAYALWDAAPDRVKAKWAELHPGEPAVPDFWPWARRWWKPKDRRVNLVRAGSLIIAEIERLDRAEARADA